MTQHHTPLHFQVEWRAPRPFSEFLTPSAFVLPKSGQKWNSRMKNNLWVLYKWLHEQLSCLFHDSCPCRILYTVSVSNFKLCSMPIPHLMSHETKTLCQPASPKLGTITDQTTSRSSCWALLSSSCATQSPLWLLPSRGLGCFASMIHSHLQPSKSQQRLLPDGSWSLMMMTFPWRCDYVFPMGAWVSICH